MHTKRFRDHLTAYLFLFPGLLVMAVWLVYPMISELNISLHNWNIMPDQVSPFLWFDNYIRAFEASRFWSSLKNTGIYALVTVFGQLIFGMIVALMLENISRGKVIFRLLYFLPVVTSWVVVSLLFRYLFNSTQGGIINYALVDILHVLKAPVSWLTEANTAFVAIDTLGIWKGIGFSMVIFLAALQSIPQELTQAAAIDGANYWQSLRMITLPLMIPTIIMVSIMLTFGAFQTYIPIALMTNGGPLHRTELVLNYMYATGFTDLDFGYSSALAYIMAAIVFSISRFQMRFLKTSALGN